MERNFQTDDETDNETDDETCGQLDDSFKADSSGYSFWENQSLLLLIAEAKLKTKQTKKQQTSTKPQKNSRQTN